MESFENLSPEERMRAENDFLKMKMMLEKGAHFSSDIPSDKLPAAVENMFLKNVVEFERQFDEQRTIKVFEKIGKPTHFKPVAEIKDEDIDRSWQQLSDHLNQFGICLDACSPSVSKRELYRFAIEELFQQEITDFDIPGIRYGFIYDEFHPDHSYDNTRAAVEYCLEAVFNKASLDTLYYLRSKNIRLNEHYPLTEKQFKSLVDRFKQAYDQFEKPSFNNISCILSEGRCTVSGSYTLVAQLTVEKIKLSGNWTIDFELDEETGNWYIYNVQIEGIRF